MENFSEPRFVDPKGYETLKDLWKTAFDDGDEVINAFFEKSVLPRNTIAVFDGTKAVSALYMLESEIIASGKSFSAYYIYAVCTHPRYKGKGLMKKNFTFLKDVAKDRGIDYLFLVPQEEYLFDVYKKQGFVTGFYYKEKIVLKEAVKNIPLPETDKADFNRYRNFYFEKSKITPVAALKEKTFESFFYSVSGTVTPVFTDNGYMVYENENGSVTVFELFGCENQLLSLAFSETGADFITVRMPCDKADGAVPYGMYYKLRDVPEIKNGFFGVPYST